MKSYIYIVVFNLMCLCSGLAGQIPSSDTLVQNTKVIDLDSMENRDVSTPIPDSLFNKDTLAHSTSIAINDTLKRKQSNPLHNIKISNDSPDEPIDYGSADSSYLDLSKNHIHLYNDASVKYGKYNLESGYIIFDFDQNEASAFDTLPGGFKLKNASFTDDSNSFNSSGLRYNFKSNKGIIYNAVTTEGEFQVFGQKTKFVSAEADSLSTADQIYNKNAVITTCTSPVPHYGIRSTKLKVVPNRLAVAGFSQLEISGIPTPVVVPFGFYPLVDGLSSGIIFPADFDSNPELGLGVRGVGYYFPISDHFDLTLTGDFYSRGTHRIYALSNFKKRYKYSGTIDLKYANNIVENTEDLNKVSNKGFSIRINRVQDPKAHPYRSISGSIDFSVGDFYATNYNDPNSVFKTEYASNFTFKNSLPGTPFSLIVGMSHNQNTRTGKMNITLPTAKLTMTSITPFKRKIPTSKESWYEKININGSSQFKTFVSTTDSTLFTQKTFDDLVTGMQNKANVTASFKAFKYFNISPSVTLDQYLYAKTFERQYNPEFLYDTISTSYDQDSMLIVDRLDTIYGQIEERYINGFSTLHKMSSSVSMNTQIFGTKKWSKGWLRGIRHTMKPSISFNYTPSTLSRQDSVQLVPVDLRDEAEYEYYNPYTGGIYNASLTGESKSMSFNLVNNFEGKYYSKKDSTEKKFTLFKDLRLSTSYNFAADSIKWQPLIIRGNTRLTKYTTLNLNARYDFYVVKDGRLTQNTIWSVKKRPFQFSNFDLTLTTGFTLKQIFDIFRKEDAKDKPKLKTAKNNRSARNISKGLLETIQGFKLDHRFQIDIEHLENGNDTITIGTHQLRIQGKLDLTPMWSVRVDNISYDFNQGKFVYPAFSLIRNLHCWEMRFSWYPSSQVYSFFIGVKSSNLSFLKYNYGQQNTNNLGFGR